MITAVSALLMAISRVTRLRLGNAAKGATSVEYGLIIALIAAVIITVVSLLGTNLSAEFTKVASKIH